MNKIFPIIVLLISYLSYGQTPEMEYITPKCIITKSGIKCIQPSVENITAMMNLSMSDWKTLVQNYGYNLVLVKDDCVNYSKGGIKEGGTLYLGKCSEMVTMLWTPNENNDPIMDYLFSEIEPYFKGYKNDRPVYTFTMGKYIYEFHLRRENGVEDIIVQRFQNLETENKIQQPPKNKSSQK